MPEETFINLEHHNMVPDYVYEFHPFEYIPDDSLENKRFDIGIIVRYSDKCEIKELPLRVEYMLNLQDSLVAVDKTTILFDDSDEKLGKGNYGIFETDFELVKDVVLDNNFMIYVSTPQQGATGIISLGVRHKQDTTDETDSL